jgi:thioesterase domain-containing protein/acyl carrier protein
VNAVGQPKQTQMLLRRADLPLSTEFAPVQGATETRLMALWVRALETGELGALDDFFELGGDSMMAASLFAEIEAVFGRRLPLSTLLDHPTVRSLAALLDEPNHPDVAHPLVPIRAEGEGPPLILIHAALGNVLFAHGLMQHLSPRQPVYAIQARGLLEGETPHRRFEAMAEDYAAAIRSAWPHGPYLLAGLCAGSFIALEIARLLKADGGEVALLVMMDPQLHPSDAPWIRWRNPDRPLARLQRAVMRVRWLWQRRLLPPQLQARLRPGRTDPEQAVVTGTGILAGVRDAFLHYRPAPYDGAVKLLMSEIQREEFRACEAYSHRLAQAVEVEIVGSDHAKVMDWSKSKLADALQRSIDAARAAAKASSRDRAAVE